MQLLPTRRRRSWKPSLLFQVTLHVIRSWSVTTYRQHTESEAPFARELKPSCRNGWTLCWNRISVAVQVYSEITGWVGISSMAHQSPAIWRRPIPCTASRTVFCLVIRRHEPAATADGLVFFLLLSCLHFQLTVPGSCLPTTTMGNWAYKTFFWTNKHIKLVLQVRWQSMDGSTALHTVENAAESGVFLFLLSMVLLLGHI